MVFNYQQLLKTAKAKLPEIKQSAERFEIPRVTGHVQGNKTIISNFIQICTTLRREPAQIVKYLQRELATPASQDNQRLILGRKLTSASINEKIAKYTRDFVLCKECGKPDTQFIKEDRFLSLKCTACGARHPIHAR
ncbi:MAG: translation initiation factor IF-2 subunit beta [Nanoarchaeota archaeon]